MFELKLCLKCLLVLFLFNSIGCINIENNAIKELESIIEKDFQDISTNSELIPLRKLEVLNFEEIIKKFETNKKKNKEFLKNTKPPDINRFKKYIPIGDFFFYSLISINNINKHEFITIMEYVTKYNNIHCEIKTKSSINSNLKKILKQKIKIKFQEFGYPIMYENTLIFFRNNYSVKPGLGTEGSGNWYIYKKKNDTWRLVLRINQWIT